MYVYRSLLVYNNCMKQKFLQNECTHFICSCHSRISRIASIYQMRPIYLPKEAHKSYAAAIRESRMAAAHDSFDSFMSCRLIRPDMHELLYTKRDLYTYQKRPICCIPKETYMRHDMNEAHARLIREDMNEAHARLIREDTPNELGMT